jgi:putative two-component system response regulator
VTGSDDVRMDGHDDSSITYLSQVRQKASCARDARAPAREDSAAQCSRGASMRGGLKDMTEDLQLADLVVMVVDDEPDNRDLLLRLLQGAGFSDVMLMSSAEDAVALCAVDAPDLLLLDLRMPGLDGLGVLDRLAGQRKDDGHFPVLVLTGDDSVSARRRALSAGADDFLAKPFDPIEVQLRVEHLLGTHVMRCLLSDERRHLQSLVVEQTYEIELTRAEVLDRLALTSEFRDDDTQEHAMRIGHAAAMLAEQLGCSPRWSDLLCRAAPLHDIGKLGISDAILLKPGPLTREERMAMQEHTTIGARILGRSRSELLQLAQEVALTHHERWDGSGYPAGMAGEQTPQSGRIVAVADVFDALSHVRPYKAAWPVDEARGWIVEHAGTHFDPEVVQAFVEIEDDALLGALH